LGWTRRLALSKTDGFVQGDLPAARDYLFAFDVVANDCHKSVELGGI
jgi:hypothetical protein